MKMLPVSLTMICSILFTCQVFAVDEADDALAAAATAEAEFEKTNDKVRTTLAVAFTAYHIARLALV